MSKALAMPFAVALLAGCTGVQSTLDPAGPGAQAIASVWWWMFGVAMASFTLVMVLWWLSWQYRASDRPAGSEAERIGRRWIIWGGIVLPGVSIAALLAFGMPAGRHTLPMPLTESVVPLRIDAIGHQWFWEVHYPDSGVRLENEIRLPVGRPIHVHTTSSDVIHSFWVPRLGGKVDAVPGRTHVIRLQADVPGEMRGQCAEFCGLGHAHMVMMVHAMEPAAFDAWLQAQHEGARVSRRAAPEANSAAAAVGGVR